MPYPGSGSVYPLGFDDPDACSSKQADTGFFHELRDKPALAFNYRYNSDSFIWQFTCLVQIDIGNPSTSIVGATDNCDVRDPKVLKFSLNNENGLVTATGAGGKQYRIMKDKSSKLMIAKLISQDVSDAAILANDQLEKVIFINHTPIEA
ncbi:hypothetical protein MP638_001037 [Amoeboaphelidium occidentale]|nr:hypothetical protein MP638_001037 [Amoeboaphelidium occidentale]